MLSLHAQHCVHCYTADGTFVCLQWGWILRAVGAWNQQGSLPLVAGVSRCNVVAPVASAPGDQM